jgi:hypothetical protein
MPVFRKNSLTIPLESVLPKFPFFFFFEDAEGFAGEISAAGLIKRNK